MATVTDMGGTLHDAMSEARFLQVTNQGTDSTTVQRGSHRAEYVRRRAVNESPFTSTHVTHVELNPNVNAVVVKSLCKNKHALLVHVVYFEFRFHNLIFLKNSCIKNRIWNSSGQLCLRLGQGFRVKPFYYMLLRRIAVPPNTASNTMLIRANIRAISLTQKIKFFISFSF